MDERPIPLPRVAPVWKAWQTLSTGRPIISSGFGATPGAIPFRDIDAYATRFGPHDTDEFDELLTLIGAMDTVYLKHAADKSESDSKKKRKGNRGKGKAAK